MTDTSGELTTPTQPRRSIIGNLKARKQEIEGGLFLDVPVPKWSDPEIYVRYHVVDHAYLAKGRDRIGNASKKQKGEVELEVNIDLLIHACEAVYGVLDGDTEKKYRLDPDDPEGELGTFDSALAANLGLDENARARSIVKALFFADGGIIAHASAIAEFSDYRDANADEVMRGES